MKREKKQNDTTHAIMQKRRKSKQKKEHFLKLRMWVGYLVSYFEKDRGKIPDNIGNRILITNNLVVTKAGMSSYIHVETLSLETPQCLFSKIIEELRARHSKAVVDYVIKNEDNPVELGESGLKARIYAWENALDKEDIADYEKEIAARCLYTVDIVRSGARLMKSRLFLIVRAQTGSELSAAEKIIYQYLNSIHAGYVPVGGSLKQNLQYISLVSNTKIKEAKDIKAIINSERTLAQLLPNCGGINDKKGLYLATNVENYSPYIIDFDSITSARNLYCIAPSGGGKTVIALNLCCSAVEHGWAVCVQDIKGNEFSEFIQGTGGYIVSLKEMSPGFINSFVMYEEEATDLNAEIYFKERIAFSKRQLIILSGLQNPDEIADVEELLDEFLSAVYTHLSVLATNRITWSNTKELTPFRIYEMLVDYMTPELQTKYSRISRKLFSEYRMYLTKTGSKSYLFTEEFNYFDILKANTLMFDFGILEQSGQNVDRTLFRLKFEYMRKLNAKFVTYKHECGQKVLKILEESQIVVNDPEIMKGYVEEYTLRRSQGQTTLMLGNSVTALVDNPISRPLIENIKALIIGAMNTDAKEEVTKIFGLEKEAEWIDSLGKEERCTNAFLFVNRMQPRAITPILKVLLDPEVKYKLLTPKGERSVKE